MFEGSDMLRRPPAPWPRISGSSRGLSPAQHAKFVRMGLKRGMPDIFMFHRGLWGIEIKRRGGRLSKTRLVRTRRGSPRLLVGQEETFPALISSGGFRDIVIVTSVDEMLAQLTAWGVSLRGRIAA
jgi:hypothetical protein